MNGNQGLDALAALCGGAAKVQTSNGTNNGASSIAGHQAGAPQGAMFPIVPSQSSTYSAHNVGAYGRVLPSNRQHGPNAPFPGTPSGDNAHHAESISQFQQAMAAAMNGGFGNANVSGPSSAAALSAFISAGLLNPSIAVPHQQPSSDSAQNTPYYQYLQYAVAEVAKQAKNGSDSAASSLAQFGLDENSALALAMASSGQMPPFQQSHQQSIQDQLSSRLNNGSQQAPPGQQQTFPNSMNPPPPPSLGSTITSTMSIARPSQSKQSSICSGPVPSGNIIPQKTIQQTLMERPHNEDHSEMMSESGGEGNTEDKRQMKRVANRRSAQLSRKRKKVFIEELREENDDLRRKEMILRSIPDLIVVFDSGGKLWFVSHAVGRFLDFTPEDLEGTSFWNRLCAESVRLMKAAFMDALAARKKDMETAPLGSGVWELQLVDKDGTLKIVTLHGVVHFSGETPECVCSIRPRDGGDMKERRKQSEKLQTSGTENMNTPAAAAASIDKSRQQQSDSQPREQPQIMHVIKPQQSVISNGSSSDEASAAKEIQRSVASTGERRVRGVHQISDGESIVSESGSDE